MSKVAFLRCSFLITYQDRKALIVSLSQLSNNLRGFQFHTQDNIEMSMGIPQTLASFGSTVSLPQYGVVKV